MKIKSFTNILFPLKDHLYILQLEEYKSKRMLGWFLRHPFRRNLEKKKRLAWTNKAKFLFLTSLLLIFATCYFLSTIFPPALLVPSILLALALSPIFLVTSLALLKPYEVVNKEVTVRKARRCLAKRPKLIIIGITGSFGKTSVKEILKQILSKKYRVLATPWSYNTVFGIAKIALEKLKPHHEIFIVEMGTYRRGEIKTLCRMTPPKIGILTGINEQHLERLSSVKNITVAKYELIEALPSSGMAIFNNDNFYTRRLADKTPIEVVRYSTEDEGDIIASNISVHEEGSAFTVIARPLKKEGRFKTKLLGRHNILNILAATAAALKLGMDLDEISKAIKGLSPIPHRLQLIDPGTGVLIIDDTYSSNPDGFKAVLEVLKSFEGRRKIIVTPGIVELGKEEGKIHKELGKLVGETCDIAILVGRSLRTEALKRGLKETEFPAEKLVIVKDLEEAKKKLKEITQLGDLILFENDLPDQYS